MLTGIPIRMEHCTHKTPSHLRHWFHSVPVRPLQQTTDIVSGSRVEVQESAGYAWCIVGLDIRKKRMNSETLEFWKCERGVRVIEKCV